MLSGIFLITIFPLIYFIVGIIIKLTSPGPIFFTQKRTGLNGVEFKCYKFRSMKVNEEADSKQATVNDPRKLVLEIFFDVLILMNFLNLSMYSKVICR